MPCITPVNGWNDQSVVHYAVSQSQSHSVAWVTDNGNKVGWLRFNGIFNTRNEAQYMRYELFLAPEVNCEALTAAIKAHFTEKQWEH